MFNFNMTMVIQILNFFILLFVLKKFAYKPLLEMMEARRNKILTDLDNAEKSKEAAQKLRVEYEEQLAKVKQEAQVILDRANKIANETRDEIINQARAEQERLLAVAREQIAREQQKAISELRDQVADLSMLVAQQVVGQSMNTEKDKLIIDEVLSKIDSKQGGMPC